MVHLALSVFVLCFVVVTVRPIDARPGFENGEKFSMAKMFERFTEGPESFDLFFLSTSWPKTICMGAEDCKKSLKNLEGWIIHGLWPARLQGEPPISCGGTNFSISELKPLMGDLLKYWPDLFIHESKDQLWRHEWEKHGTCAVGVKETANELMYFGKVLELFKAINITSVLNNLNIVPSETKPYDVTSVSQKLKKYFSGIEPVIMCRTFKDKNYFEQIEVCFDKQFKMIDCINGKMTSAGYETTFIKSQTINLKFEKNRRLKDDETRMISLVQRGVYKMKNAEDFDHNDRHLKSCREFVYYPVM